MAVKLWHALKKWSDRHTAATDLAIAVILAIQKGVIHPTINQFEQDPKIGLNVVRNRPMEAKVDHALSNGFGFGGHNASIVISRFRG